MPPVHPDFVHFPIALITVAFAAEISAAVWPRPAIRSFAWATLLLGFLGLLATLASGFIDMHRANLRGDVDSLVDLHWKLGVVLAVLLGFAVFWRWRQTANPSGRSVARSSVSFLIYFAFVFAVLCLQGWFGGELAYAHGAGVAATGQGMVPSQRAAHRIDPLVAALRHLPWFSESEHEGRPAHDDGAHTARN